MDDFTARALLSAVFEPDEQTLRTLLHDYQPTEIVKHPFFKKRIQGRGPNFNAMIDMSLGCYTWITPNSNLWPTQISRLGHSEPVGLWLTGEIGLIQKVAIAIAGTRSCSRYGVEIARKFASKIAATSITIISGEALGVERAAHRGALYESGKTIAVLAGGLTHIYPISNSKLLQNIENYGLIVSEVAPWRKPKPHWFLMRNRLTVGLSEALVVIEASEQSSAMSYVTHANSIGIEVCAVPGPINSSVSAGCHALIRDGALLVTSAEDVLSSVLPSLRNQRIRAELAYESSV